jgi:hypothetical protein
MASALWLAVFAARACRAERPQVGFQPDGNAGEGRAKMIAAQR